MGAGLRNSKGPMSLGRPELCGLRSHGFGGGGGSLGGCDWKSDMFQGSLYLHGYCVERQQRLEAGRVPLQKSR